MIQLLLYVLIIFLVAGLVLYVIRQVPLEPWLQHIATVVVVVLIILMLIYLLLGMIPPHAPLRLP